MNMITRSQKSSRDQEISHTPCFIPITFQKNRGHDNNNKQDSPLHTHVLGGKIALFYIYELINANDWSMLDFWSNWKTSSLLH